MQIPLRFVFVYSFRLYYQNYTTIPSFLFFYGIFRKLLAVIMFFNILIDSKSFFWTVEMTECGFG